MKNVNKVNFTEVLTTFDKEHPVNRETNSWARDRLREANEKFKGEWWKMELSQDEALNIQLVYHRDDDVELIPPRGMTVLEAAKRFEEIRDDYREKNKDCYEKIVRFSKDPFSPVFLSVEPLTGYRIEEYEKLEYGNGSFVHLDGLHRLIAWAVGGRFNQVRYYSAINKLNAFIAGHVG